MVHAALEVNDPDTYDKEILQYETIFTASSCAYVSA